MWHITGMHSLWQDLFVCTKNFDFVTLTLVFDLLMEKLNLGYNVWTKRDKAFILHMLVPCDKTFLSVPKKLTFEFDLDFDFDLLFEKT